MQDLSNGDTTIADVPSPLAQEGSVLIATSASLVSAGTERMLVDFGKANIIQKARQQPDKVKMVLEKVRVDGLGPTIDSVRAKFDQPLPLGYSNVGRVLDSGGTSFVVGDRVLSNGHHAEVVRVASNLCAKVPDNVSDETAAFAVVGAIALQGVRLAAPTIGETFVVTGLGLIGLITVQILRANGCHVLGIDFDSKKCALARKYGADTVDLSRGEDPLAKAVLVSRGRGVDGAILTASTSSNSPVSQAAKMCRKRGRIVLVGVVGLELSRADFYEKELSFQVSCSYGPGRYDTEYEDMGRDYPLGFVRWTEQRNFEAVLDLMAGSAIVVSDLLDHQFDIEDGVEAYTHLGERNTLGILLKYPSAISQRCKVSVELNSQGRAFEGEPAVVSFLGAGNYASRVLIPAFKAAGAVFDTLVSSGGVTSAHYGRKFGFWRAATTSHCVYSSEKANIVVIATRHNLHAKQVIDSLSANKHVFVEKPLALTLQDITEIERVYRSKEGSCNLMVGYNRRFSPHVQKMKSLLDVVTSPKVFVMTMNAGHIAADHWTQSAEIGGGRIIGEACHYIDLMRFLADSPISSYVAKSIKSDALNETTDDKAVITLTFEDGSLGTIHYLANGGKAFPKERIEVFANDAVLQLDNFRILKGFGWKGFNKMKLRIQDKGQKQCVSEFVNSVAKGEGAPIPFHQVIEVAKVSIEIAELLKN